MCVQYMSKKRVREKKKEEKKKEEEKSRIVQSPGMLVATEKAGGGRDEFHEPHPSHV